MAQSAAQKAASIKKQEKAAIKKQEAAKAKKAEMVAAKKAEMATAELNVVEGPIQFTNKEAQNIVMIGKNQDRILKAAGGILDIAVDIGNRLLELKDAVKKHGGKWKAWAQDAENLPFSYEQANRYSKLAANPEQFALVKADGVTSIEQAVMAIEHLKKPEKQAAHEAKQAEKAAAPAKAAKAPPSTINAAVDIINGLTLEDLREIQSYITDRIEELTQAEIDVGEEDEGDDNVEEALEVAGVTGDVDPLS